MSGILNSGSAFLGMCLFCFGSLGHTATADWWGPGVKVLGLAESAAYAWSPDGLRFVTANGDGLVYRHAPGFRANAAVVPRGWSGATPIEDFAWSPDGETLVFVSPWSPGNWLTIWETGADGNTRDLLPPPVSDIFASPGVRSLRLGGWSGPRELIFLQHCGTECSAIFKVHLDRHEYGHLCTASLDGTLHWTPAGDRALFPGHNGALLYATTQDFEPIWNDGGLGTPCREILPGCSDDSSTHAYAFETWSPDGSQALLSRHACDTGLRDRDPGASELYRWAPGGGEPDPAGFSGLLAAWSPDGSRIALLRQAATAGASTGDALVADLHVVDANSGVTVTRVTLGEIRPASVEGWESFRPRWSPDATRIVYRNRQGLYVMHSDGSDARLLVRDRPCIASWSPDSRRLAIRVSRQANFWLGAEPPYLIELE